MKPITVEITLESKKELAWLISAINAGTTSLSECSSFSEEDMDKPVKSYDLWVKLFETYKEQQNEV